MNELADLSPISDFSSHHISLTYQNTPTMMFLPRCEAISHDSVAVNRYKIQNSEIINLSLTRGHTHRYFSITMYFITFPGET